MSHSQDRHIIDCKDITWPSFKTESNDSTTIWPTDSYPCSYHWSTRDFFYFPASEWSLDCPRDHHCFALAKKESDWYFTQFEVQFHWIVSLFCYHKQTITAQLITDQVWDGVNFDTQVQTDLILLLTRLEWTETTSLRLSASLLILKTKARKWNVQIGVKTGCIILDDAELLLDDWQTTPCTAQKYKNESNSDKMLSHMHYIQLSSKPPYPTRERYLTVVCQMW